MTRLVKLTIFASALALAGLGASSFAADKFPRRCIDCIPGGDGGPPDVGNGQNQGNQGGRQRQIEAPQGQKGLDQGYATHRKFHPENQPGVGNNGSDQGYATHRKFHPEDQPGVGDNGPDQGMPDRHVRKYHPDNQPSVGDNGPDQGLPDRHVRKYHPDGQPDVGDNGLDQGMPDRHVRKYPPEDQPGVGDNGPDQGMLDPHVRKYPPDQLKQGSAEHVTIGQKRKHYAERKWKFDPNRHERRRHKDKRFRFFFGGFWYPEPYWDEFYEYYDDDYIETYGVSCLEGAEIVAERFDRVRILDCYGGVFTYLGRRYGESFEIELSSLTGRILNAHEI
jgi:hypothetical protein